MNTRTSRPRGWMVTTMSFWRTPIVLALVASLAASSSIAGLILQDDETDGVPAPENTVGPGPAEEEDQGTLAGAVDDPWWPDWLNHFDQTGTGVDDRAEELAQEHVEAGRPDEGVPVMISYLEDPGPEETALLVDEWGADSGSLFVLSTSPTILATVPAHRVSQLGSIPGVVAVEWDYPLERVLTISAPSTQAREFIGTGTNTVYNGMTAESLGYTGAGTVVAVIDTGVQSTHPAVAGEIIATADSSTLATVECTVSHDMDGHGTHVASTAAGNPVNDNHKGTAMDAQIVDIQITKQLVTIGGVQRGLDWVHQYNQAIDSGNPKCGVGANDRINVATVSFGSTDRGGPNAGSTETTINNLVSNGVVVTIAVGNCGPQPSALCNFGDVENGISSPGNAANAIGVAASSDANMVDRNNDAIAAFSSRGPNSAQCCTGNTNPGSAGGATGAPNLQDRHRKPDITGPGVGISAANAFHITGPEYVSFSGTSMATPHMAGIAALLFEAGEDAQSQVGGPNLMWPTASSFAGGNYVTGKNPVRDAIMFSADYRTANVPTSMLSKWEGPNSAGVTWNNAWGYGSVDAFAAICWAWQNVLEPSGATPPATVASTCPSPLLSADAGGPYEAAVEEPVTFSGSATAGEPPYAFEWDFGDGNASTGAEVQHAYTTAGNYTVQLIVTDDAGTTINATTNATVTQDDEQPPEESGPFVEITNPANGTTVENVTLIEGIAGNVDNATEVSTQKSGSPFWGSAPFTTTSTSSQPLSFAPGEEATLWFRGDEAAGGVGTPNVDGATAQARLLPEPPTGTVPVVHTGTGFGLSGGPPITLASEPLEQEIRIGSGDGSSAQVETVFQLAPFVPSTTNTFLVVDLVAVQGNDSRLLAQGLTDRLDENFLLSTGGLVELALEFNPDEMNGDGDLVVSAGEQLQVEMHVQTPPFTNTRYSILYDAEGYEGRMGFPVSPLTGSPVITEFTVKPGEGEVPLEVAFNGSFEPGLADVDRVEIDPGDGSAVIEATLEGGSFGAAHTYTDEGEWTTTATVTDVEGRSHSAPATVTVLGGEPEAAVFVQIDDGDRQLANDTSAGGNWSTWSFEYDFSAHENGTEVAVTAVYFDGQQESDPDTINVTVASDDNSGDPAGEGNVTIESPEEGAALEFPVTFEGTYDVQSDTGSGSTAGVSGGGSSGGSGEEMATALPAAPKAPLRGATQDKGGQKDDGGNGLPSGGDQEILQQWLSDPFVQEAFGSPEVQKFEERALDWEGYFTLFPDPEERRLVVALTGAAPVGAPPVVDGIPVHYEEHVEPEPLGGMPVEGTKGHDDGPNLPGIQGGGAGPGAPLRMGGFICSASYLVQDEDTNRYYISTAGHCLATQQGEFFGSTPGAPLRRSVSICIEFCVMNVPQFGDWITFTPDGDYQPVFYARHQGVGADFGLIEVPDEHVEDLRPVLTQWGGPDGMENPSLGRLLAHYGHGSYCCPLIGALATRTPADQGRLAVSLGSNFNEFSGLGWPTGGDSGSAVSSAAIQAPGIIQGQNAVGVLTHGVIVTGAPILSGTTMASGLQRAGTLAGTDLRLVTQHEDPVPSCPDSSTCPPVARFTHEADGIHASFDASRSFHPRYVEIVSYQWDFGDGATGEGQTVEHTYQESGTFQVELTVTDANGEQNTTVQDVTIKETASPWRLEVRVVDGGGNETVPWNLVERPEPGESGTWSFTWEGPADAGDYFVQARLTENNETRDVDERRYEVVPEEILVDTGGPYEGTVGEPVAFNGSVEGGVGPFTFDWDFGDGSTATGEDVQHTYMEVGEYTVILNVTDAEGRSKENATLATITEDPAPFVEITAPKDQDRVEGITLIEGIAGHNGASTTSSGGDGDDGALSISGGHGPLTAEATAGAGTAAVEDGLSFDPGEEAVLWFRGDEAAGGVGTPNVDGATAHARLLPEPPTGTVPVVHTGTGFGLTGGPQIALSADPFEQEIRIGSGNGSSMQVDAIFQLAPFVPSTTNTFLVVDLVAVQGDDSRLLAQGLTDRLDENFLLSTGGLVELALEFNPDEMNGDGDLVVSEGETLRIEMHVQTPPFTNTRYSILYDAEGHEGRIGFPVSPLTGSPVITKFETLPDAGGLPLEVTFNGSFEPGLGDVDQVLIDPGDGSDVFEATLDGQAFSGDHVYREEGVWEATATVIDTEGRNGTATATVTVAFEKGVYLSIAGDPIERATDTSEGGDWATWAFEHDFSVYENGTNISIEAVYFDGGEMSEPHVINVIVGPDEGEPEAVIEGPERVQSGENATFDGSASQGNIVEWTWDFDDGNTASGAVVEHAWDDSGPKNVTLTVKTSHGATDTATHRVNVTGGSPW